MAGGANGSRVAEYTQDSGLILASVTRPCGGAASLVGWGLVGGRQSVANGKNKCQPTKYATYYYRVYPVENVI